MITNLNALKMVQLLFRIETSSNTAHVSSGTKFDDSKSKLLLSLTKNIFRTGSHLYARDSVKTGLAGALSKIEHQKNWT